MPACVLGLPRARSAERDENGSRGTEHERIEGLVRPAREERVGRLDDGRGCEDRCPRQGGDDVATSAE
jgi:hypothetical protein